MKPVTKEQYDQALAIVLDAHRAYLDNSPNGICLDLTGSDLRMANLTQANLTGANLEEVNLTGARLVNTNLFMTFKKNLMA
jgi:uncharacterized protein YjbI with pentapeptide repeats